MKTRDIIIALLLIGCSFGVAGVFALMWLTDNVRVVEPNLWIRGGEMAMALGMLGYGIWYFFSGIMKIGRQ